MVTYERQIPALAEREYTRGDGIETYNMQTGTNYLSAIDFTDDNNQWTFEEHNNSL